MKTLRQSHKVLSKDTEIDARATCKCGMPFPFVSWRGPVISYNRHKDRAPGSSPVQLNWLSSGGLSYEKFWRDIHYFSRDVKTSKMINYILKVLRWNYVLKFQLMINHVNFYSRMVYVYVQIISVLFFALIPVWSTIATFTCTVKCSFDIKYRFVPQPLILNNSWEFVPFLWGLGMKTCWKNPVNCACYCR